MFALLVSDEFTTKTNMKDTEEAGWAEDKKGKHDLAPQGTAKWNWFFPRAGLNRPARQWSRVTSHNGETKPPAEHTGPLARVFTWFLAWYAAWSGSHSWELSSRWFRWTEWRHTGSSQHRLPPVEHIFPVECYEWTQALLPIPHPVPITWLTWYSGSEQCMADWHH